MKVLLHTCCGPCASACVPRLKSDGHAVTMLFANSNIDTESEFDRRLGSAKVVADAEGVNLVALPYDHADWCEKVASGYEDAAEKGARCERCFRYNLSKAAEYAAAHGFESFATSLTISPHKVSETIFAASDDSRFLKADFKKRDGFKASLARSAELGLYRQDYCGCEFSRFEATVRKYDAYVSEYRDADGKLPSMMQLKRVHTGFVVRNARMIASAEKFDPPLYAAALTAALLHDTGRYEQLRRYDTFRDSESVDHAVLSHQIVIEKDWTDDAGILDAVLYHNRRELPDGLSERTFKLAHTVRDADKLDIFRVFEDQVANTDWRTDARAFWNLSASAPPNPAVVAAIEAHLPVDYQNIRSLADFILIQIGWMISGLHFAASRRLCRERGHLEFRRNFLHELSGDQSIDRICDMAENGFAKK